MAVPAEPWQRARRVPGRLQHRPPAAPPLSLADARPIFDGYARDPEVTRFVTWQPHSDIGQTKSYIRACMAAADYRTYVLVERRSGKVVGGFDVRRSGPARLGYGYVLARSSWGAGLMTEALAEVVRWGLSQPDIWRVGDVCDVDNLASARVMEKAGLVREGVLRRWMVHPNASGEPRDCFSYAKVR